MTATGVHGWFRAGHKETCQPASKACIRWAINGKTRRVILSIHLSCHKGLEPTLKPDADVSLRRGVSVKRNISLRIVSDTSFIELVSIRVLREYTRKDSVLINT